MASLRPGSLVIGCATVAPTYAVELGQRLAASGLLYLDAPISGGAAKAAAGEMTMMTSGPADAYAKAESILAGMAGKVYRLGDVHGLGSKRQNHQPVARRRTYCRLCRSHGAGPA